MVVRSLRCYGRVTATHGRPAPGSSHSRTGVQRAYGVGGGCFQRSGRSRRPCAGVGGVAESLADRGERGRDSLGLAAVRLARSLSLEGRGEGHGGLVPAGARRSASSRAAEALVGSRSASASPSANRAIAIAVGLAEARAATTASLAAAHAAWSLPPYDRARAWFALATASPARSPEAASAATPR